ncbi:MAG: sulfatase [Patescibacteria group bacterium]
MDQRSFIGFALAGLALSMFLGCSTAVKHAANKPNVLFIAVDDLRPDFGCYGNTAVKSPNMDRLASEGLLFQRAYCQMALCMPSRASLLSGYRTENINYTGKVIGHVPKNTVTLPQLFRKSGYTTVSIGKVYHYNIDDPEGWVRRYTDTFYEHDGYCSGYQLPENINLLQNYFTGKRMKGNLPASEITEITNTPDEKTPDGIIARRAIEELQKLKKTGEPFFLAAGFYRPHMPLTAPKKYWDMYDRTKIKLPADFLQPDDGIKRWDWEEVRRYGGTPLSGPMPEEKAKEIIHGYHASITFVDVQIGKVLDELQKLGLDKNTIVVLWSDNSWTLGEHGRWSKVKNYEIATRVTMMMKVPWLKAQKSTPALAELIDMYPTLAELCKLPAPGYLEGTSFVPLLTDPDRPWKTGAFSCLFTKARTIRTDRYRLIEHPDGQLELYDHANDPAEDLNLAKNPAHADTLKKLQEALNVGWRSAQPTTK